MSLENFFDSIKLSLEYQYDHGKKPTKKLPRLFITLSREPGSGAISVGEKVAEILNSDENVKWPVPWKVFDKDLVKTIIDEHKLPEECKKYMPEGTFNPIYNMLVDLLPNHPSSTSLVHRTNETILHLAHLGSTIIVGRGGSMITKGLKGGFHVRLVGSMKKRVKRVMEFSDLDEKAAEKRINDEEKGRKKYYKEYFSKNLGDPVLYNLVINTDDLAYDQTAKIIVSSALISSGII